MSHDDRIRWDAKYSEREAPAELTPNAWLREHVASLPPGRALDLACGLGHNAIWLAQCGWQVDAVDISPVGLRLAGESGARAGVKVHWITADLDEFTPEQNAYDLVCVFRFLDRIRLPRLIEAALRPGGHLLYETITEAHMARPGVTMNPAFALGPGELPRLFPGLEVIRYDECELPDRSVARLVARR